MIYLLIPIKETIAFKHIRYQSDAGPSHNAGIPRNLRSTAPGISECERSETCCRSLRGLSYRWLGRDERLHNLEQLFMGLLEAGETGVQ